MTNPTTVAIQQGLRQLDGNSDIHLTLPKPQLYYQSALGKAHLGDSRALMDSMEESSVDLVLTSPPFALKRKKEYGNEDEDKYVEWFDDFARGFKNILKPNGSLVIDLGGAYKPGFAVRSIYQFELLVSLVRKHGFYLAQEFFHYNPARLPAPAEWVNVRRIRVKDSVNVVWWLSKSKEPKADNRNVLREYSESMKSLLRNGYKAKLRPSGHDISDKFSKDNGGAIPPNLLEIANTDSNSSYMKLCRENGLKPHPARFPSTFVEFFLKFLTDEGDSVFDPFGGSNTTGRVCEDMGRKWSICELSRDYLDASLFRFSPLEIEQFFVSEEPEGAVNGASQEAAASRSSIRRAQQSWLARERAGQESSVSD